MQSRSAHPDPRIRAMTDADLEPCLEVYYEALDELHLRVGQPVEERFPDAMLRTMASILGTDPATCWVAESADELVAFGQAVRRGDVAHLSFLFVRLRHQGQGLGRRLLEHCLPGATRDLAGAPAIRRLSVAAEAIQPVSTALYAAYGMLPRLPVHTVVGVIRPDALPGLAPGITARPLRLIDGEDPEARASAAAVAAIDLAAYGFERPEDHLLAHRMGRTGYLFEDAGGVVRGYGYVAAAGRLAPTVVDDPDLLPGVLGHLVRTCDPATTWSLGLPGPNAAFPHLLAAGLLIEGPPILYCATWPGPAYERIVPTGFALP